MDSCAAVCSGTMQSGELNGTNEFVNLKNKSQQYFRNASISTTVTYIWLCFTHTVIGQLPCLYQAMQTRL